MSYAVVDQLLCPLRDVFDLFLVSIPPNKENSSKVGVEQSENLDNNLLSRCRLLENEVDTLKINFNRNLQVARSEIIKSKLYSDNRISNLKEKLCDSKCESKKLLVEAKNVSNLFAQNFIKAESFTLEDMKGVQEQIEVVQRQANKLLSWSDLPLHGVLGSSEEEFKGFLV